MAAGSILIVEDEAIVAQDLSSTVERLGYDVVEIVTSGTLAVTRAAVLKPDAVFMDITLDGDKDGVMAAKVISGRMNIPVIFVTAHTDKNTIDRVRERCRAATSSNRSIPPRSPRRFRKRSTDQRHQGSVAPTRPPF